MADAFMGEIKIVSFNFAPKGWAQCNGQLLPINQNQALFSLFGTSYGGDGRVNFALPNLRGRMPNHFGSSFVLGQSGGEVNHTVITSELPAHSHVPVASSGTPTAPTVAGNIWATQPVNGYASSPTVQMNPLGITSTGGSQAHTNMQPYLVLNFVVALQGIFPSRN